MVSAKAFATPIGMFVRVSAIVFAAQGLLGILPRPETRPRLKANKEDL
jgi:hypothetical protein